MSDTIPHSIQPITDGASLAGVVKSARQCQGLRQADLALAAGVSPQFLSALENGKATVRLDSVLAVLAALNLDLCVAGIPNADEDTLNHA